MKERISKFPNLTVLATMSLLALNPDSAFAGRHRLTVDQAKSIGYMVKKMTLSLGGPHSFDDLVVKVIRERGLITDEQQNYYYELRNKFQQVSVKVLTELAKGDLRKINANVVCDPRLIIYRQRIGQYVLNMTKGLPGDYTLTHKTYKPGVLSSTTIRIIREEEMLMMIEFKEIWKYACE